MFAMTMGPQDISFENMSKHHRAVADVVRAHPEVDTVGAFIMGGNQVFFFARMKPHEQRKHSVDEIIADLRPKVAEVPSLMTFMRNPPPIQLSGQRTASEYQLTLQSVNLDEIYQWTPVLVDKMRTLPGFVDVNSDMQIASPEVTLDIDRDRALALGVTPQQIQNALASSFGSREVSTIYAPANQYSVILETEPKFSATPNLCRNCTCALRKEH